MNQWAPIFVGLAALLLGGIALWRLERIKPIKGWEDDERA